MSSFGVGEGPGGGEGEVVVGHGCIGGWWCRN